MIDLHCHSHFSDGLLSPEELITLALDQNIQYLSLTDHDTLLGYPKLREAARDSNIQLIQGIELSVRWKKRDVHILAYQINPTPNFEALLDSQIERRIARARAIGDLLRLAGVEEAYTKACEVAGHLRVGRPHFAAVLVKEAKAKNLQSAFRQFLVRGRIAYVPSSWVGMEEAISSIIEAKGQAVLAHPLKYGLTRLKLHELIKDFKDFGGEGVEVVSGDLTMTEMNEMAGLSLRYNLFASSGSDYHGPGVSRVRLGGQSKLPLNCKPIWHQWGIT